MTQYNFEEFQELVEPFEPEMSLKSICEQEGVPYRAYITWRMNHGISKSRRKRPSPTGLIELEVENAPQPKNVSKVTVQMEFENGIRFCREGMEVESLIEFLTKIKPVLCLS